MNSTSNERPPPHKRERAHDGEASSNGVSLRHPATTRQSPEQASARLWIGATWIVLVVETAQSNAHGACVAYTPYFTRTRDPDAATAAYRAATTDCGLVEARITPVGRMRGDGIKLAYALKDRGVPVSLDPLDERAARAHATEIAWANSCAGRLDALVTLPEYVGDR